MEGNIIKCLDKMIKYLACSNTYTEKAATLSPVPSLRIAFISSDVNEKSKISMFSLIRLLVTDLGIGTVPCWY